MQLESGELAGGAEAVLNGEPVDIGVVLDEMDEIIERTEGGPDAIRVRVQYL